MRLNRKERKNQIKRTSIIMLALVFTLFFTLSGLCQDVSISVNLSQLESELSQYRYSGFQQRMILTTAESLFELGINSTDLNKLLVSSIGNNFDAYNIKKIMEILIDAKQSGISEKSLINKFKEGLSKKVDERLIVEVMSNELENLKIARNIYTGYTAKETDYDSLSYDEDIIVESLAESLNNGVPRESLSEVLNRSAKQGRSLQEITEVSTELGILSLQAYELGFTEEEISSFFQKAVQGRSGVDGVCEDIQDILVGAAAARLKMATSQGSDGSGSSTSSSSATTVPSSGEIPDIVSSPDISSGSAPTVADDKPDSPDKPDGDSSPPEN